MSVQSTGVQGRHEQLAFYGVPSTGQGGYVYVRMKYFTQLSISKNPIEHNRKYVDEKSQRNDVVGYNTAIAYAFDNYGSDQVLADIAKIHKQELTGASAVRPILLVNTWDDTAVQRSYTVVPGSEGDDANIYTYSGSLKANGELVTGKVTTADNYKTVNFSTDDSE